jgi:RecG-like helicase
VGIAVWDRLTRTRAQQEALELHEERLSRSCERICDCNPGDNVTVTGTVRSVTIRPKQSVPALEIELYDGSGSVTVIWLGRRRIPGIDAGRRLVVNGRLTMINGAPLLYNPKYELKPTSA